MISKHINKLEEDYGLTEEKINELIKQMMENSKFEIYGEQIDPSIEIKKLVEDSLNELANRPKGKHKKKWLLNWYTIYLRDAFRIQNKAFLERVGTRGSLYGETREFVIGENENEN